MIINSNGGRQLNNPGLKVGDKIKIMRPDLMWDNTIYFNEYGLCDKEEFEKLKINPIPDFKSGDDEYFNKGDIGIICYQENEKEHWGDRKYYISIKKNDNNGVEFDLYSHLFSLKEIGEFAEKIEDNNMQNQDIIHPSPSTTQRIYQGWEIIKLAQETDEYMEFDVYIAGDTLGKCAGLKIGQGNILHNVINYDKPSINFLFENEFILREQKYVTFDEARKSGKSFKYKDWRDYVFLDIILIELGNVYSNEQINKMLDEKAWMINE